MQQRPPARGDILIHYVKLRRGGQSMSEAIETIKPEAFQLALPERNALGNDIKQWENEQHSKDDQKTATLASPAASQGPTPLGATIFGVPTPPPAPKPAPNAPRLTLKESEMPLLCPNCGTKNAASAERCVSCGATLKSKEARTRLMKKPNIENSAHPPESGRVFLAVKTRKQPLEIYVNKEMIIGRSSPESSFKPDIDLAPYEGEEYGVSRSHASLTRQGDTIVISDLESSNETHINGERLYPHEARVLRHGDEVALGKLMVKVMFKL